MLIALLYAGDIPIGEKVAFYLFGGLVVVIVSAILIGLYMLISSKIFPPDTEQTNKPR